MANKLLSGYQKKTPPYGRTPNAFVTNLDRVYKANALLPVHANEVPPALVGHRRRGHCNGSHKKERNPPPVDGTPRQ
jgi:hypothetical protein